MAQSTNQVKNKQITSKGKLNYLCNPHTSIKLFSPMQAETSSAKSGVSDKRRVFSLKIWTISYCILIHNFFFSIFFSLVFFFLSPTKTGLTFLDDKKLFITYWLAKTSPWSGIVKCVVFFYCKCKFLIPTWVCPRSCITHQDLVTITKVNKNGPPIVI